MRNIYIYKTVFRFIFDHYVEDPIPEAYDSESKINISFYLQQIGIIPFFWWRQGDHWGMAMFQYSSNKIRWVERSRFTHTIPSYLIEFTRRSLLVYTIFESIVHANIRESQKMHTVFSSWTMEKKKCLFFLHREE